MILQFKDTTITEGDVPLPCPNKISNKRQKDLPRMVLHTLRTAAKSRQQTSRGCFIFASKRLTQKCEALGPGAQGVAVHLPQDQLRPLGHEVAAAPRYQPLVDLLVARLHQALQPHANALYQT